MTDRYVINSYIDKVVQSGSRKNDRSLKDGVFEIKIDRGSGFRIYFGEDKGVIILLFLGGDKRSQDFDIAKAKEFWRIYVQKQ